MSDPCDGPGDASSDDPVDDRTSGGWTDDADDATGDADDTATDATGDAARTRDRKRELGIELLAHLEDESLSLPEAVDRIETVTESPSLTREILDAAEKRGIVDREDGRLLTRRGGTYVSFDRQVVVREGDFECRRCGASISTGHFVRLSAGELGPFGSSCVRKVTGRES